MTLQQFLANYYCKVNFVNQGQIKLVITTELFRRVDNQVLDKVQTSYDIQEINEKISDSHTFISLMPIEWDKIIDYTKRAHLGYLAQRVPIDNYYPNDLTANLNIANMYV